MTTFGPTIYLLYFKAGFSITALISLDGCRVDSGVRKPSVGELVTCGVSAEDDNI
jgi:ABC-type microcin C transport system permease subunit YejE